MFQIEGCTMIVPFHQLLCLTIAGAMTLFASMVDSLRVPIDLIQVYIDFYLHYIFNLFIYLQPYRHSSAPQMGKRNDH